MPVNRNSVGLSSLPDYLSDEELRDIADARRNSWNSGFIGAGAGLCTGFVSWYTLCASLAAAGAAPQLMRSVSPSTDRFGPRLPAYLRVTRNHSILFVLGSGCAGMFFGALTGAKNSSHLIQGAISRTSGRESSTFYQRVREGREGSVPTPTAAVSQEELTAHERALEEHEARFLSSLSPEERTKALDPKEVARRRAAAMAADEWWLRRLADPNRTGELTHKPLDKDGRPVHLRSFGPAESHD